MYFSSRPIRWGIFLCLSTLVIAIFIDFIGYRGNFSFFEIFIPCLLLDVSELGDNVGSSGTQFGADAVPAAPGEQRLQQTVLVVERM